MTTKTLSKNEMSSMFFEIGLALQLRKISTKEVEKLIPCSKLNKVSSVIEHDKDSWDDSVITQGETLEAALEIHEISQAELARRLKVNPQKVNDLIKGRMTLTPSWAKRIGTVLNVSYKNFL